MSVFAAGYVRVSTQEQKASVLAQVAELHRYANDSNLVLLETFVDIGISGSTTLSTRPQGQKLIKMLDSGDATVILSTRLDRLWRNDLDSKVTRIDWLKNGYELHLTSEGGKVGISKEDNFMIGLRTLFAEYEREQIKARVEHGMIEARKRGVTFGVTPYGWRKGEPDHRGVKHLEPVEAEQIVIARILSEIDSGASLRSIARALEAETGKKSWTPTKVRNIVLRAREKEK